MKMRMEMKSPSLRDWLIIKSCNFMLWFAEQVYDGDELQEQQKDLVSTAWKAIR